MLKAFFLILKQRARKYYNPPAYNALRAEAKERYSFYKSFLMAGDLVFDVGANFGNRIEPLLMAGTKVVAVEPQNLCHKYLQIRYGQQITLLRKALGATKAKGEIHICKQATTVASLSTDWIKTVQNGRFKGFEWNKSETVEIDTADNVVKALGIPKFIKIDVEGFETEVLKGLSIPVFMVSYEYTTPEQTDKAVECLNLLGKLSNDYRFNFAKGETKQFALPEWKSHAEFLDLMTNNIQVLEGFGDIYACLNPAEITKG